MTEEKLWQKKSDDKKVMITESDVRRKVMTKKWWYKKSDDKREVMTKRKWWQEKWWQRIVMTETWWQKKSDNRRQSWQKKSDDREKLMTGNDTRRRKWWQKRNTDVVMTPFLKQKPNSWKDSRDGGEPEIQVLWTVFEASWILENRTRTFESKIHHETEVKKCLVSYGCGCMYVCMLQTHESSFYKKLVIDSKKWKKSKKRSKKWKEAKKVAVVKKRER